MSNNQKYNSKSSINVLTITATFPSLIQPWLVSQLVQIKKFGGENFILSRREELENYSLDIDKYNLKKYHSIVPENKFQLAKKLARNIFSLNGIKNFFKNLKKLKKIIVSNDFSTKEKLFSVFLIPYFNLKNTIDIIHCHSEVAGNKLLPIIKTLEKPMVITFHGMPPVGVKGISDRERARYIKKASTILVNTEFAKDLYNSHGAPSSKIKVLPQGINLNDFPFKSSVFSSEKINILTVGRLARDKGQKYAISAVAKLIQSGVDVHYRLVGNGPDREELESLCLKERVTDHVEILPEMNHKKLQAIYAESDIFILPSIKSNDNSLIETQGVVLQEAQATGLIVIATKVGGIPECIENDVTGFLIKDKCSESIFKVLKDVIAKKNELEKMRICARSNVEKNYDINIIGEKINKIYSDILLHQ